MKPSSRGVLAGAQQGSSTRVDESSVDTAGAMRNEGKFPL